ncbi:MAG: hypothetical protein IKO59_07865 [Bacteroidales bacterium]|nr:hypothetical protein [Bacteroidales bacterium]
MPSTSSGTDSTGSGTGASVVELVETTEDESIGNPLQGILFFNYTAPSACCGGSARWNSRRVKRRKNRVAAFSISKY